jgi:hypothetical protein
MMMRRMTFVLLLIPNGMTGCTLSSVPMASLSPRTKSQLAWSGTLIRLATGFCVCFASSSAVCALPATGSARSSASAKYVAFIQIVSVAERLAGSPIWTAGLERAYCRAIATLKRSSGEIR